MHLDTMRVAWLTVLIGLALFAAAGAQIGSNLEPVVVKPLSADRRSLVMDVKIDGDAGMALIHRTHDKRSWSTGPVLLAPYDPHTATIDENAAFTLEPESSSDHPYRFVHNWTWSARHPAIVYVLAQTRSAGPQRNIEMMALVTVDLKAPDGPAMVSEDDPMSYVDDKHINVAAIHIVGGRLYLLIDGFGSRSTLLRYDLSDPRAPRVEKTWSVTSIFNMTHNSSSGPRITFNLPPIEDLTWDQRFELCAQMTTRHWSSVATPGYVVVYSQDLQRFTTSERSDDRIEYEQTSLRRATPLESLIRYSFTDAMLDGDLLYLVSSRDGMVVFDISDPAHTKKVGHYITPTDYLRCLDRLPDGRIAAFGRSMHVFDLD